MNGQGLNEHLWLLIIFPISRLLDQFAPNFACQLTEIYLMIVIDVIIIII